MGNQGMFLHEMLWRLLTKLQSGWQCRGYLQSWDKLETLIFIAYMSMCIWHTNHMYNCFEIPHELRCTNCKFQNAFHMTIWFKHCSMQINQPMNVMLHNVSAYCAQDSFISDTSHLVERIKKSLVYDELEVY